MARVDCSVLPCETAASLSMGIAQAYTPVTITHLLTLNHDDARGFIAAVRPVRFVSKSLKPHSTRNKSVRR